MTTTKQDQYEFYDDHAICHSKSGNTYLIMYAPLTCNCVGFNYYQYCRHSTHTKDHLTTHSIKSHSNPPVNGNPTTIQDNIMHQLIHGKGKE